MKMELGRLRPLLAAVLVVVLAVWMTLRGAQLVQAQDHTTKLDAARRMQACMERVAEYKRELELPVSQEDWHQTGMIGDPFTPITTTLGAIEAKRTSANSDMAAMVVQMLNEAGVGAGDTVGAGFSGSFPALDLAVLAACDAMGVHCVYIASVGSSTYGGNQPELTMPDMVCRLAQEGLVSTYPAAITPGGAKDCGTDMDPQTLDEILARLAGYEIPIWSIPDFEENLEQRMARYSDLGPITCFIGVGGNLTTQGRGEQDLGQGVLRPDRGGLVTPDSGLLQRYSGQGLPVIYLLNMKKLTAEYGLPYDPQTLPEMGTSAVYYTRQYPLLPGGLGLAAVAVLLIRFRKNKNH